MTSGREEHSFWRNAKVMVTGAGGFIGSHLVERLLREGAEVKAFVRYNSRGDIGLLSMLSPDITGKLRIIAGDLRDLPALRLATENVEYVFHLGALVAIPYSYLHPVEIVGSNVMGTMNMLLAARDNAVQRIVHTSTSEVYGTALRIPIDETHPLQGQSPYSASKIGADKLVESFYCSYGLPVVTVRPFNTYGPRQSARAIIPTIITQALTQQTLRLGNLDARRDFTYVSDTVNGFLRAGETPGIEGQTFNLGVGKDIGIKALADKVSLLIGKPLEIQTDSVRERPEKSEVQRLLSDNRRAGQILGWVPEIDLHEGILRTLEWISEHLHLYRPEKYEI